MTRVKVAFHPSYVQPLPPNHRFPMSKYDLIPQQLVYEGILKSGDFFEPELIPWEKIELTHDRVYLEKLQKLSLNDKEVRALGFPLNEALVTRGRRIAGGSLECGIRALTLGIAMNIAGGTHHAFSDRGEGFCVFNDVAVALNILINEGYIKSAAVIDLDVHQGNGTASLFQNNPKVFTMSIHGQKNYPIRKETSDLDVGLEDGTGDDEYLYILKNALPKVLEKFKPGIIYYNSGVDILASDKLGRLKVSPQGCYKRDLMVFEFCHHNRIPVVAVMGGGYSPRINDITRAHSNTFRAAVETFD